MKKLFFIIYFILLFLSVEPAFAHTGLHESEPKQGDTVTESIRQLVLTFESKIENGSTVELKNSAGEIIKPEKVSVETGTLTGAFQPLDNGEYTVIWKVIGSDGHPIEGEYAFTVNAPVEKAESNQQAADDQGNITDTQEDSPEDQKSGEGNETGTATSDELPSAAVDDGLSPLMISVLILVAIGIFLFLWRVMKRG